MSHAPFAVVIYSGWQRKISDGFMKSVKNIDEKH